ncbi:hypothetical protein DBR32_14955 [Taibaiella sp. KBW10]|uniref:4'-phosphopantetheinyl transferase family protein n=1 Tax=Taibaiella sp. KBW10 TaxID=2153357 RepID=UPI000F5B6C72|nr:4'-phosphopantetheinyl transferase superfamily protein [Taibaiella sp. KBW10]RQO29874.1 hypothetical protein DBR32_14955 [Taibaiella sp. KBW10]
MKPIYLLYYVLQAKDDAYLEQALTGFPEQMRKEINRYSGADRHLRIATKIVTQRIVTDFAYTGSVLSDIQRDRYNRPFLPNTDIRFTSAHSHYMAVVAASTAYQGLGVDVEFRKAIDLPLLEDCLHPGEITFLREQEHATNAFYEIWTRKEAVLKASGLGISKELNQVDAHKEIVFIEEQAFFTQNLLLKTDYALSVAATDALTTVQIKEVTFP